MIIITTIMITTTIITTTTDRSILPAGRLCSRPASISMPLVEVCVEGIDAVRVAEQAGADRVELCASLLEGGLTPSLATIKLAVEAANIPVFAMIRPRGGDFLYTEREFASMRADVRTCRRRGVPGVYSAV